MRIIALGLLLAGCSQTKTTPAPPTPPTTNVESAAAAPPSTGDDSEARAAKAAASLIGIEPPEWHAEHWLSSPPLQLAGLRGSVVLVRWWTAGCPYCSATAPALRTFHQSYADRGLRVIGMYHHKEDTPFEPKVYEETAKKYGFTFPVAFDPEWRTLESWLRDANGNAVDTGFTSVTFLIDKKGVIRYVHPGGQYVKGDAAYAELQDTIERLLAEKA